MLANSLTEASLSLAQGLAAAEKQGTPISGKFEIENGALQLSVYTMKGDQFAEVIVDHKSGSIKGAVPITESDDLKDAKARSEAMAQAKLSLASVVANSAKDNADFPAISAIPKIDKGRPVVIVTLMKGTDVRKDIRGSE